MGQFLNLRGEKTSENAFYKALCEAVQSSGVNLVDYCCAESIMLDENINSKLSFKKYQLHKMLKLHKCHKIMQSLVSMY